MSDLNVGPVAVTAGTAKLNPGGLNVGDQILTDTAGSMTFAAVGARLKGNFGSALHADRVMFQATSGGITSVGAVAVDNVSGSAMQLYALPDPDNSPRLRMMSTPASGSTIYSLKAGTGALMPLSFGVDLTEGFRVTPNTCNTLFGSTTDTLGAKVQITGGLQVVSGSTILPASTYLFWGATTGAWTGFYSPGTPFLTCTVNGNEVWRASSTGNMLVGTTSDNGSDKLQVAGNIYTSGTFRATYLEVVGSGGYLGFGVYWNGTAWVSRAAGKGAILRNDSSGVLSFQFVNSTAAGAIVTPTSPVSIDLNSGTVNATSFAATGAATAGSLVVSGNASIGNHLEVSGGFPQIRAIGTNNTTGGVTVVDSNNKSFSLFIGASNGTDGVGGIYNGATGTHPITIAQNDTVTINGLLSVPGSAAVGGITSNNFGFVSNGGLYANLGDGASSTVNNIALKSWYGIGFSSVAGGAVPTSQYSHWFDTRSGNSGQQGQLTAWGGFVAGNGSDIQMYAAAATPTAIGGLVWRTGDGVEQHRIWDDRIGDGALAYRYLSGSVYRLLHSNNGVWTPGGAAIVISGQNLNTLLKTGFYRGSSLVNAPNSDWYYITVIGHDPNWTLQEIVNFGNTTKIRRQMINGTWSPWIKDFTESSGSLLGTLLINPYANSSMNLSQTLLGFGSNSTQATQVWKIATLPASSVATRDHIVIEGVFDDNWDGSQKAKFEILMSNRGSFTYRYYLYGDTHTNSVIHAYRESDGSISVWAGTLSTSYSTINLNIKLSFAAAVYKDPVVGTPTGTMVFNSADSSAYPPNIVNGTSGNNTFVVTRSDNIPGIWNGRVALTNPAADVSSFLGNWGGKSGVFAHNAAFSTWREIWINTLGQNDSVVHLPASTWFHTADGLGHTALYNNGAFESVTMSNWFRSSGATGWYNETFQGGIVMTDSSYVRTHNNKGFVADVVGYSYYPGVFSADDNRFSGKVLQLLTNDASGTDGPQIHFIHSGTSEWGFGIEAGNGTSLAMYAGGNSTTFGTKTHTFGTNGSITAANSFMSSPLGGPIYTGTKAGGSYGDNNSAVFRAVCDNSDGSQNLFIEGFAGGVGGTRTFNVRADGLGYFAAGASFAGGSNGLYVGPYAAGGNWGCIYSTAVTPAGTNYSFSTNGSETALNAQVGPVHIKVANSEIITAASTGVNVIGSLSSSGAMYADNGGRVWSNISCASLFTSGLQYGYQKLANGLILMWKTGIVMPGGDQAYTDISFPTTFPTAVLATWTGVSGYAGNQIGTGNITLSSCRLYHGNDSSGQTGLMVFALGY